MKRGSGKQGSANTNVLREVISKERPILGGLGGTFWGVREGVREGQNLPFREGVWEGTFWGVSWGGCPGIGVPLARVGPQVPRGLFFSL